MLELDDKDIQLLYKKIVLVDEDPLPQVNPKAESLGDHLAAEPEDQAPVTVVQTDTQPTTEVAVNPFAQFSVVVMSTQAVKESLHSQNSNWSKIINALDLNALKASHISIEELESTDQLSHCKAVWCIGLTKEQEAPFTKLETALLFSPNPETLNTVEEKRSMFEPLKQFAPHLKA